MIFKKLCIRYSTNQLCYLRRSKCLYTRHSQSSHSDFTDDGSKGNRDRALKHLLENSTGFIDTKIQHEENQWATLPYVEGTIMSKRERAELDIDRPKIDPRDTSIIIFPGDGVQFVGMAKSLTCVPAARDLFDYASEILKYTFQLEQSQFAINYNFTLFLFSATTCSSYAMKDQDHN